MTLELVGSRWSCPLAGGEIRLLLEDGLRLGAAMAELLDLDGVSRGAIGSPAPSDSAWEAEVNVRGRRVALLRLHGPAPRGATLEPAVGLMAQHLGSVWTLGGEVDSLAAEVLRAYSETHVIQQLGEVLTGELSVECAADQIIKTLLPALEASWTVIRLNGSGADLVVERGEIPPSAGDADRCSTIETPLRSAGLALGTITAGRAASERPFSSVEARLLDAMGALAGNALRNSQLFEELNQKTGALEERETRLQTALTDVAYQALHDGLTQLPNRTLLADRLNQTLRSARRDADSVALLLMDLDRFKDVNDTYGHHAGDELLKQASRRLRSALRESDTIARLGGDEFAVLLPQTGAESAHQVARRLLKALDRPFKIEGRALRVGGSIGIALSPDHANSASALLQCADVAMYVAKRKGTGICAYSPQQDDYRSGRLALLNELRVAIEQQQLRLLFQPKVSCESGALLCAEALVRWEHPQRGLILPDQFIPLAEETGLIRHLSRWVLRSAIDQCRAWHQEGLQIGVAVNLSMRDLHDSEMPGFVADLLEKADLAAKWLVVEVTESMLMADPERAMEVVQRLCEMGVRISIDDFGMGYSSLAYLRRLPVHEIKIDREFIRHMTEDRSDTAIVRSTIGLGHDLGLTVVAEGVEDGATLGLLSRLGCDAVQGYYHGRPMEAAALALWDGPGEESIPYLEVAA